MTIPTTGFGTSIGLGEESTYGTPVSRANWLRVRSAGVSRKRPKVARGHLGTSGATSRNRRDFVAPEETVDGSIEVFAAYDDSTIMLCKHALGAVATAGVGPYVHTVSLGALPTGLTIEQLLGDGGKAEVFEGCKIGGWELSVESGSDGMVLSVDVIGKSSGGIVSAGTPSYSANGEIIDPVDAGQFVWNAVSYDIRSIKVSGNNAISTRPSLGSVTTLEPTPTDFLEITAEIQIEVQPALHAALLADTQADGSIVFTGTGNNKLTINLQNAVIESADQSISGPDVVLQTVTLKCLSDGTNQGCTLVFENDSASATAN